MLSEKYIDTNKVQNFFINLILNDLILNNISSYIKNRDLHNLYKTIKILLPIRQFCYWNLNYKYSQKYYTEIEFRNKLHKIIINPNKQLSLNLSYCDITNMNILCNIHTIKFDRDFNQPIDNLPNSIEKIELYGKFNQPIDNLPNSIKYLMLGNHFDQPINNLPNSLIKLNLGQYFNHPVDNLPNTIIELELDDSFNQPINNLPQSLKYLTLGNNFNQSVHNLPRTIIHLTFGYYFNQPIDNLPETITHLTFGWDATSNIKPYNFL